MIETKKLSRFFGTMVAVQDLSLSVKPGELYGFLGPNGAGKTTTIRMLVGLLRPTSGSMVVAGHDVEKEPLLVKQKVGYLAQSPQLYERLTGREFLRFLGGLFNLDDEIIQTRTDRLLDMTGLSEKGDQLIESYSGGMRHKIGLCGALLHEPSVLILDEPLTGLDPYSARQVKDLLRTLCKQGRTVFLSTHVLEIAERVCDRVGILNKGQLIADGSVENLRSRAQATSGTTLEDLFLQLTGDETTSEVVNALK